MDLDIEYLGARGDGVARGPAGEIFVPCTLAGERIRALVAGGRGRLEEVLTASPDRVAPPCRHFGDCGGCALQHLEASAYLRWKQSLVVEALRRAGFDAPPVNDVVAIPAATRRRATFAVERRGEGGIAFGFLARASHRIVAMSKCHVLHSELFGALPGLTGLAASLPSDWRAFDVSVTLCENGLDVGLLAPVGAPRPDGPMLAALPLAMSRAKVLRLSLEGEPLLVLEAPRVRFADVAVALPPGGFLQASAEGEAALVSLVTRAAAGARRTLDLFCGSGALSLPLSRTATVHAIDSDPAAVAALAAAAKRSPHRTLTTEVRNLFERPVMAEALADYGAVVFDPPRAGAAAQAAEIARSRVPAVIAVSCNPSTFARDAGLLVAGGYRLREVTPVDQFVYSAHLELAAVFSKE